MIIRSVFVVTLYLGSQQRKGAKEDEIGYVDYHFDPDAFKKTTYNYVSQK